MQKNKTMAKPAQAKPDEKANLGNPSAKTNDCGGQLSDDALAGVAGGNAGVNHRWGEDK